MNYTPNNTYEVLEVNAKTLNVVRGITGLPGWSNSSVATDDQNNLYVTTKSFVGGDIKIFRPNTDKKPYIEIKDPKLPVAMLVTANALWVGYYGYPFGDV